ncbi:MAG: 50S ribosomal protein L6 [Eubacteriaceae bacterium]|nr:50S ribosomal protein L6 [Eubacteriaceae bacterium]
MSRIGKAPINIPSGVDVKVEGGVVTVKGPKGELKQTINDNMEVKQEQGVLTVSPIVLKTKKDNAMHGLTRKLISNMVEGVSAGFNKDLEIVGVGYRADKQGNTLVLNLGYSHQIKMEDPEGITTSVEGQTKIKVSGIDRQKVGQHAANIKSKRPPEPYKGKGIRYAGEYVRIKEGKTGK